MVLVPLLLYSPAAGAAPSEVVSIWEQPVLTEPLGPLPHVNENAPKGGMLRAGAIGTYDSFNRFCARGNTPAFLQYTYETLSESSRDDSLAQRGLLAQSFDISPDYSSVLVTLRPEARFQDGSPVTGNDVVWTFNALVTEASPYYKGYYALVQSVEAVSDRQVRFTFSGAGNRELPLIVGQLPVLPAAWWKDKNLGDPQKTPPPGSGPYVVSDYKMGSSITYTRDPNWWGAHLPVNRGRYNVDTLRVDYYRDTTVCRQAFLAGELDYFTENTIKDWMNSYAVPPVERGDILRQEIPQERPMGMRGLFLNTRRPVFSDIAVRKAVALLFDFEWTNRALFHDKYLRHDSFFTNSVFAAPNLPGEDELALLEPWREKLPAAIFGPLPAACCFTDGRLWLHSSATA